MRRGKWAEALAPSWAYPVLIACGMRRISLICGVLLSAACFAPVHENGDGGQSSGGGQSGGAGGAGGQGGGGTAGAGGVDPCLDADHDGFVPGLGATCSGKHGGDCDDSNAAVNPRAGEECTNGRDDDC